MAEKRKQTMQRARDLLAVYYDNNRNKQLDKGELLNFDIEEDIEFLKQHFDSHLEAADVSIYNITKPLWHNGKRYLFGRVEPRKTFKSKIMLFAEKGDVWRLVDELPPFELEDPFYIPNIHGYQIFGGVHIEDESRERVYRTYFYKVREHFVDELVLKNGEIVEPFAKGPAGMKDIRLIELKNGKIAVFTRPQGNHAGLGKIGYIEIDELDQLEQAIPKARILENQFHYDEWGGVNELHLLKNGKIGVLGHIAHHDGEVRHYYAMAFIYDPQNHIHSHLEILTTAEDFPPVRPKNEELGRIIFSGGLHRKGNGSAYLYVGIGDAEAGRIKIKDPFTKAEND